MLLGKAIRERRLALGVSVAELSVRTDLSPFTIQGYELGRRLPPLEALDVVSTALDTDVRSLLRDVWPWDGAAPVPEP